MKSMSQLALFMFYYLLSSAVGQRDVKELPLMRHASCSNRVTGETGICTFNWSCVNVAHGVHIGHCVDRFFVGTCCKIPEQHEKTNVSDKSEENAEMDSSTSLFHILAAAIQKQKEKIIPISSTTLSSLDNEHSRKSSTTAKSQSTVYKGYWDYSFISNHNRKPVLLDNIFSHTSKPNYDLYSSTQSYSIQNHNTSNYQDKTSIHLLSHRNKTSLDQNETSHDQRTPVNVDITHDLRKPVRKPVDVDVLHDQRKPISLHETFDQRKPVTSEMQHHVRNPVPLEEDHDQRWPVLDEESHDERLKTKDAFDWFIKLYSIENNTISYDELLYFTKDSKPLKNSESVSELNDLGSVSTSPSDDFYSTSWRVEQNSVSIGSSENNHIPTSLNQQTYSTASYLQQSSESSEWDDIAHTQESSSSEISQVCGRSRSTTTGRIVGGRRSHSLRWPWMISLQRYEGKTFKHKCGATLLNQFWAATVAHCVDGKLPRDLKLRLGEYNFLKSDELHPHVERRVYVMVVHPEFNPITYENDLALLRFEDPVQYQTNIVPICLPSFMDDITGRIAVVTGWGKLAEEGELPDSLHEVYVPIISNIECEKMYYEAGYTEAIRDVFVCAGLAHGGIDACEGDSGGPMVVKGEKGEWILVGLISWGISCAAPKQPGVYTRISEFKDWINGIILH